MLTMDEDRKKRRKGRKIPGPTARMKRWRDDGRPATALCTRVERTEKTVKFTQRGKNGEDACAAGVSARALELEGRLV